MGILSSKIKGILFKKKNNGNKAKDTFTSISFEILAGSSLLSVSSVSIVRVVNGKICQKLYSLIKPPLAAQNNMYCKVITISANLNKFCRYCYILNKRKSQII